MPTFIEDIVGCTKKYRERQPGKTMNLFALADAGQDRTAWQRLHDAGKGNLHLLSATGSTIDDFSPYLIHLGTLENGVDDHVEKALSARHFPAAYTVLISDFSLQPLHQHLNHFTEVKLAGGHDLILAFWDPAILGTLVGQADDDTLHVPGSVLRPEQLHEFLNPIACWWYWDREDHVHSISIPEHGQSLDSEDALPPFVLDQAQEDALVEAGVPDQILYYIELNRPTLFDEQISKARRYRFIRAVLPSARNLGLEGMRDLVNFTALCLIYRQRIETDPQILGLLGKVKQKAMSFDEALKLMPE